MFPPFFAGFAVWEKIACAIGPLRPLAPVACRPESVFAHLALRLPPTLLDAPEWRAVVHQLSRHFLDGSLWREALSLLGRNLILAELVVVALPEEFFFRGYVQGRLGELWPARRTLWGAPVGMALRNAALAAPAPAAVRAAIAKIDLEARRIALEMRDDRRPIGWSIVRMFAVPE